jgi:hypothetical protein
VEIATEGNQMPTNRRRTPGQQASLKKATEALKGGAKTSRPKHNGIISANEAYDIETFLQIVHTTRSGLSEMRRRGLKTRSEGGRRVWILGSEFLEYLKSQPVAELEQREAGTDG